MGTSVDEARAARARVVAHASVVGALAAVPVPWFPELGQVLARRRLVDDLAREHEVVLGSAARRALGDALAPSERAVTGSELRRFAAARLARRVRILGALPALEAAVALTAGAFLLGRAFERCNAAELSMTEGEAVRTRRIVHATLEGLVRPEAVEEILRRTGALAEGLSVFERVRAVVADFPREALDVLTARFDEAWDSQ